jgi:hypothetical protein
MYFMCVIISVIKISMSCYVKSIILLPEVVLNSVLNEALYYVATVVLITAEAHLRHNSQWRSRKK